MQFSNLQTPDGSNFNSNPQNMQQAAQMQAMQAQMQNQQAQAMQAMMQQQQQPQQPGFPQQQVQQQQVPQQQPQVGQQQFAQPNAAVQVQVLQAQLHAAQQQVAQQQVAQQHAALQQQAYQQQQQQEQQQQQQQQQQQAAAAYQQQLHLATQVQGQQPVQQQAIQHQQQQYAQMQGNVSAYDPAAAAVPSSYQAAAGSSMMVTGAYQQQAAFPQQNQMSDYSAQKTQQSDKPAYRSFIGTVSNYIPSYGFVDSDTYFTADAVLGRRPSLGERVKCEAVANTQSADYGWMATVIECVENSGLPPRVDPATAAARAKELREAEAQAAEAARQRRQEEATKPYNSAAPPTEKYEAAAGQPAGEAFDRAEEPVMSTAELEAKKATLWGTITGGGTAGLGTAEAPEKKPDKDTEKKPDKDSTKPLASFENYTKGIGSKLLGKMGFNEGSGLGAKGQGITAAIEATGTVGRRGLGVPEIRRREPSPPRRDDRARRAPSPAARRDKRSRSPRRRSRSRSRSPRRRSRSSSRSASDSSRSPSPPRPRYFCLTPDHPPLRESCDSSDLRRLYKNMHLPADFVSCQLHWVNNTALADAVPLSHPIEFRVKKPADPKEKPSEGKEKEKEKEGSPQAGGDVGAAAPRAFQTTKGWKNPADGVLYRWSTRVIPMSGINPLRLHPKSPARFLPPISGLSFLVGRRGKNELMGIGGDWTPEDGPPPDEDPSSLVTTACRTFKELAGVDLSKCKIWFKFAELTYLREEVKPTQTVIHKVCIFLVDSWSVAQPLPPRDPTPPREIAAAPPAAPAGADAATPGTKEGAGGEKSAAGPPDKSPPKTKMVVKKNKDGVVTDAKELTVMELQRELKVRSLETSFNPLGKGKQELVDRLQPALDAEAADRDKEEEEREREEEKEREREEEKRKEEEARRKKDEERRAKEQARRARKEAAKREAEKKRAEEDAVEGMVTVQPMGDGGKFDCCTISLSGLLDYTLKDSYERTFEVSLFAEVFHDMLHARFGGALLRALPALANYERVKEARQAALDREEKARKQKQRDAEKAEKERKRKEEKEKDKEKEGAKDKDDKAAEDKGEVAKAAEDEDMEDKGEDKEGKAEEKGDDKGEGKEEKADEDTDDKEHKMDLDKVPERDVKDMAEEESAAVEEAAAAVPAVAAAAPMEVERENGGAGGAEERPESAGTGAGSAGTAGGAGVVSVYSINATVMPVGEWLLACRFYDKNRCGYLEAEDVEDILMMVGNRLPRRLVRDNVDAVTKRGRLPYTNYAAIKIPVKGLVTDAVLGAMKGEHGPPASPNAPDAEPADQSKLAAKVRSAELSRKMAEGEAKRLVAMVNELQTQYSRECAGTSKLKKEVEDLKAQLKAAEEAESSAKAHAESSKTTLQASLTSLTSLKAEMLKVHESVSEGLKTLQ